MPAIFANRRTMVSFFSRARFKLCNPLFIGLRCAIAWHDGQANPRNSIFGHAEGGSGINQIGLDHQVCRDEIKPGLLVHWP